MSNPTQPIPNNQTPSQQPMIPLKFAIETGIILNNTIDYITDCNKLAQKLKKLRKDTSIHYYTQTSLNQTNQPHQRELDQRKIALHNERTALAYRWAHIKRLTKEVNTNFTQYLTLRRAHPPHNTKISQQ